MHNATRGKTGSGTLIMFIAAVVVALIAAGVVLYLAEVLREQLEQLPYLSVALGTVAVAG